jgi:glycosyltransferase involved in cell wall biosynthesis
MVEEKISVIIIAKDEETKIRRCLEGVKWADEIVFVDQSSTDRTREIARDYTDKIFITPSQGTCNADRIFAISKATNDWILLLDADEVATPELHAVIEEHIKNKNGFTSFYIARKNMFLGKWIKGGGWYPAYTIKLFRKGFAYFPQEVHHDGWPTGGKAGYIDRGILHYTYTSISQYLAKLDRFTTCLAEEAFKKGQRITYLNFIPLFLLKPPFYFFRKYFLWGGYQDGFRGFFIAFSSVLTLYIQYTKIWELQQTNRK